MDPTTVVLSWFTHIAREQAWTDSPPILPSPRRQWLAAHGRIQEERSIIWLTQPPWELGATGAGEKGERKLGPRPAMWEVCACEQQQQQESGLGSAGFAAAGGGNGLDGNMVSSLATFGPVLCLSLSQAGRDTTGPEQTEKVVCYCPNLCSPLSVRCESL